MKLMKNINIGFNRGSGNGFNPRNNSGDGPYSLCDDDMVKLKVITRKGTELINLRITADDLPDKYVYKVYIDGRFVREIWDWRFKKDYDPESYDLIKDLLA